VLYIAGTAFGTAGGRLIFGIDQALSSRYMTPALMAWAALMVMAAPWLSRQPSLVVAIPALALLSALAPQQWQALRSQREMQFERQLAALAIELGVRDQLQIGTVYPSADGALALAEVPVKQGLSLFGRAPLAGLRARLGQADSHSERPVSACRGALDETLGMSTDARFLQVRGWFFDPAGRNRAEVLDLVDERGHLVGFAATGQHRGDVAQAVDKTAGRAGFKGYLQTSAQDQVVFAMDSQRRCALRLQVPALLFTVQEAKFAAGTSSVGIAAIVGAHDWRGSDFQHTVVPGMKVLGSFVDSDANTGSVTLQLQRGDRLFYRSGPSGGRQFVEVLDSALPPAVLPTAADWQLLSFTGARLPDRFLVRFSDQGNGWGEWSALALLR